MKYSLVSTLCLSIFFVTSCGGGNTVSKDSTEITKADFYRELKAQAGSTAVNCGEVQIGGSVMDTYSCVGTSFNNREAFYATYVYQGFEGEVPSAIVVNGDFVMEYWEFDRNPSGGVPGSPARIDREVCDAPQLNSGMVMDHRDIFVCSN